MYNAQICFAIISGIFDQDGEGGGSIDMLERDVDDFMIITIDGR